MPRKIPVQLEPLSERILALQKRLGVDEGGVIGPVTLSRLEDLLPASRGLSQPGSLRVSLTGLNALVGFEVSSQGAYERLYSRPIWPGGGSGVTIGIGYDLGMNKVSDIRADWSGKLADVDVQTLTTVAGQTGEVARAAVASVQRVKIPYSVAVDVFRTRSLPVFAARTLQTYPGADRLPADAQAALLSLIYNRGPKLAGPARAEMLAIRDLVAKGDLKGIAAQFRAMKRLWDPKTLAGVIARREREAQLVEASQRSYPPGETIRV